MPTTRLVLYSGALIVAMLAAISAVVGFNGTSSAQPAQPVTARPVGRW